MTIIKKSGKVDLIEEMRKLKQLEVDSSKSKKERNKLGQFSTPRNLADEILEYAKKIGNFKEINFLDPAFGIGSFYTALIKAFGHEVNALGFEIDTEYFTAAKGVWEEFSLLDIKKADFTLELADNYRSANLLVCNPPYIRHQHINPEAKKQLKISTQKASGYDLSGLAGMHAYFMLLSHSWLQDNGLAIWLVPSEILEVNYGQAIRDYLLNKVDLERIHFFDQSDAKFADALVSSCIIVYRKKAQKKLVEIQMSLGSSFLNPNLVQIHSKKDLIMQKKWSKHLFIKNNKSKEQRSEFSSKRQLGDIFAIKRGIATGDNSFFVLEKQDALNLEIPKCYLKNILPPSKYLKEDIIRLDNDGFLDNEKKLVLLDIDLPLEKIKELYPILYRYLLKGIELGVNTTYLASRRTPWYSQEKRQPPAYFVRYMNRESKNVNSHHSIFIKNESDAVATNSYLMLYTKPGELFTRQPSETELWAVLKKGLDKLMYSYGRTYGGGLVKFEPNELKQIPI